MAPLLETEPNAMPLLCFFSRTFRVEQNDPVASRDIYGANYRSAHEVLVMDGHPRPHLRDRKAVTKNAAVARTAAFIKSQ